MIIHELGLRKIEGSSTFSGKGTHGTAYQRDLTISLQFITRKDFKEAKGGLLVFKTTLFSPKFRKTRKIKLSTLWKPLPSTWSAFRSPFMMFFFFQT